MPVGPVTATAIGYIGPLLVGALFTLGLTPFDFWPAIPASAGLLWALLARKDCPSGLLTGWLYGLGFFGAGASWVYVSINVYGSAPPLLAGCLTLIFCGGLALLFAAQGWLSLNYLMRREGLGSAIAVPALWVLFEWLRGWLLTGFPWLYAGYGVLDTPIAGWVPLIGVFGASYWLIALGVAVSVLYQSKAAQRRRLMIWTLGLAGFGLAGVGANTIEWTRPAGTPLQVALYQPNIPLTQKWDRRALPGILAKYRSASAPLYDKVDILLWPESALPAFRHRLTPYLEQAAGRARESNTTLISGIPILADSGLHNSIIAVGKGDGEYHKQKLVPFGEYVPLESWLRGLIRFFDLPMSNFVKGPPVQPSLTAGDYRIAPFICYEVVYPDFVSTGARGSDLLVTVSNDSWFGQSIGPLQHLQMARFRALETGRDMLRGTNNGVSAIVNHKGALTGASEQFVETTLLGEVTPRRGATPVMVTGSWPVIALCLLIVVAITHRQRS